MQQRRLTCQIWVCFYVDDFYGSQTAESKCWPLTTRESRLGCWLNFSPDKHTSSAMINSPLKAQQVDADPSGELTSNTKSAHRMRTFSSSIQSVCVITWKRCLLAASAQIRQMIWHFYLISWQTKFQFRFLVSWWWCSWCCLLSCLLASNQSGKLWIMTKTSTSTQPKSTWGRSSSSRCQFCTVLMIPI